MALLARTYFWGIFRLRYLSKEKRLSTPARNTATNTGLIRQITANPPKKIASRIMYQTASYDDDHLDGPLVLLMPWLKAKSQHVKKYSNIYLKEYGWDVLTVSAHTGHVMLPTLGAQVLARRLLDTLTSTQFRERPVLLHGISVGVYVYFEMLVAAERIGYMDHLKQRIVGQIYDSAIDVKGAAGGMAQSLLEGTVLQKPCEKLAELYLAIMKRPVIDQYERASNMFCNNPINAPSLFIFSEVDPIGRAEDNENYIKSLEENMGYKNISKLVFKDSKHVKHLRQYEREYLDKLRSFMDLDVLNLMERNDCCSSIASVRKLQLIGN